MDDIYCVQLRALVTVKHVNIITFISSDDMNSVVYTLLNSYITMF